MKIRQSFLIRWLLATDEQRGEQSVIDIEHVQSGDKHRARSFEEAGEWMKRAGAAATTASIKEDAKTNG